MGLRIIAVDIETDTDAEPVDADVPAGLDPRAAAVISAAVHDTELGEPVVFDGDEVDILTRLDALIEHTPAGLIVTWNGANFDLPYLATRYETNGIATGLRLADATDRPPKYAPCPGRNPTGHWAQWYHHGHLDVAYAYRDYADAHGVPWSLKPVCGAAGIDMIREDASAASQLSIEALRAYNASDVIGTAALAERLDDTTLAEWCDPAVR